MLQLHDYQRTIGAKLRMSERLKDDLPDTLRIDCAVRDEGDRVCRPESRHPDGYFD